MSELITPLVVVEVPLSALVCKGVSAGYQRRAVRSKKRKMASASRRSWGEWGGGWVTSVQADKVGQCTCGSVASADTHWDEFERK